MTIALIAHDAKKELMIQFCTAYSAILSRHTLCATGTTGKQVSEATGLPIKRFLSGSQGGGLSIACACLVPEIKKCAPVVPYLIDFKRVYDMDLNKEAYEGLRYYFRSFDPTHQRENEIFERLGYIDVQNLAKRMKAELLMTTGLVDTICPPSTQFAMYNKVTSKKNVRLYPEYGHEHIIDSDDTNFKFLSDL